MRYLDQVSQDGKCSPLITTAVDISARYLVQGSTENTGSQILCLPGMVEDIFLQGIYYVGELKKLTDTSLGSCQTFVIEPKDTRGQPLTSVGMELSMQKQLPFFHKKPHHRFYTHLISISQSKPKRLSVTLISLERIHLKLFILSQCLRKI